MKKLVLSILFVGMIGLAATAQVKTPAASPSASFKQIVGLTEVEVEYSRPSKKGREIFGGLVPYDKIWRTGANASTKISFSDDVVVGDLDLKAGKYALYTKPGKSNWEIIFYSDLTLGGNVAKFDEKNVAVAVEAKAFTLPYSVESFTISIGDLTNDGAKLMLMWDNIVVSLPIQVNTEKTVMASIEKTMAGPSGNDYFGAANYFLESGKDLNKALTWINKSLEMDGDRFWVLRKKSLIQAELGDKVGAIKTAKKSLKLAKKADNADYVKMNMDSIKEWEM